MRSHTISLLMATVLLPLGGCGSMMKVEEQAVAQPVQPVQVKKAAPVRKVAVAAPVQPRVVKKPIVPATPSSERSEKSDSGNDGGNDPW
ncbi:hypothetical protein J1C56_03420 [Aminobacter anthyllidis]|uniref:Uncharacterized protein n=1 Tax=Aminobacter anthyllidis TaxID=1035067 RepID=A0A9X1A7G8_9HYPH|nr:hypothetical protein [Aminobacter anthyllidis]MBT1154632.1 hypothetical protein [Aminobacter anthyllidis]